MSACCLRVGFITLLNELRKGVEFLRASALFHPLLTAGFSGACVGLVDQASQIPASSDRKVVRTQKTFPCQWQSHWRVKFRF